MDGQRFFMDGEEEDDVDKEQQREYEEEEEEEDSRVSKKNNSSNSSSSASSSPFEDDFVVDAPQWPQSYRKSIDIYSHMPSPSFSFLNSASKGSVLPTSSRDHSTASVLSEPLIPQPLDIEAAEQPPFSPAASAAKLPKLPSQQQQQQQQDYHLKLPENGCTVLQTILNGINVLAGVGVLSTPYALKQGGWIGILVLLAFALLCCYTGILLRRCLESSSGLATYPDIGQAAFGRAGRILISIILYTELYACCVEYLILEGDNLSSLFPHPGFIISGYALDAPKVFAVIAAVVILPTVWLRDLSLLSYISAGGVLSSIIVVISVLWVGTFNGVGFKHSGPLVNWGKLPVAVGLFGFCFSGHAVFPNIYSSMKNVSKFNLVLQVCFGFCIVMYGGVAVMGYRMFGAETVSQVTLNLPKQFFASKLALWTTVITPLTKYALSITPVALSLEELLPGSDATKRHWASVVIRTLLVASTLLVAVLIPFFGFVMALIGSFLSVTGSLILPCACYMSIQRGKLSLAQRAVCIFTIALGVLAAVTGTYSSLSGIAHHLKQS